MISRVTSALLALALLAVLGGGCDGDEGAGDDASSKPSGGKSGGGSGGHSDEAGSHAAGAGNGGRGGAQAQAGRSGGNAGKAGMPAAGKAGAEPQGGAGDGPEPGVDAGMEAGDSGAPLVAAVDEILTNRYDNARTGANLAETKLTAARAADLKLLGQWPVDGQVYAQVLVASGVEIDGSERNVAVVATMNNSVYAFDADADPKQALLWHQGGMGELGTPILCTRNVGGPNGILGTPVIDPEKRSIYLVARDCDLAYPPTAPRCEHRLFQLDLTSGEVLKRVTVAGEVAVADGGSSKAVRFNPSAHWNRPGLLLEGDQLVIAFGSGPAGDQHEEDFVYHGWVFRYDVSDLDRAPDVYCTTPRGRGGSVWQAGAGPAADEHGIYVTGANGIQADSMIHPPEQWPTAPVGQEDSVVRLPVGERFPTPNESISAYADTRDYIAAGNIFQHMESGDNGFGSTGVVLVPDSKAAIIGTKSGLVYLLDRETMRPLQDPLSPFTKLPLQAGHTLYLHSWSGIPVIPQSFVFWRPDTAEDGKRYGYAYAWASEDILRSFRYDYQTGSLTLLASAGVSAIRGGGNVVLSAKGAERESGVLWASTRSPSKAAPAGQLWAFDPITLEILVRLDTPAWSKFTPPSVVRGRVFLPSTSADTPADQRVLVYGLPN
ncbi:MAG TPA: hypothetical protein VJV78_11610 [Polyangiales bacterium]|nr:hypothetical protein [Polyangiales bacterium]